MEQLMWMGFGAMAAAVIVIVLAGFAYLIDRYVMTPPENVDTLGTGGWELIE